MVLETLYAQGIRINSHTSNNSLFVENMEIGDLILLGLSLFVLIASILSIFFILRGGLLLILSGGKDEKIKPAINSIRYAIIGIGVTIISLFVFPIFANLLGLNVENYSKPSYIFAKIEEIGSIIFGYKSSSSVKIGDQIKDVDDFPTDFSDL